MEEKTMDPVYKFNLDKENPLANKVVICDEAHKLVGTRNIKKDRSRESV